MADTYDDLAALADLQPPDPRYGRMLVKVNGCWSYPGAPLDGVNLRIPRANASDARVKAAIADGVWFAWEVDAAGRPVKAMPITSVFYGKPPLTPVDAGSARALAPTGAQFEIYRGSPPAYIGDIAGLWMAAFKAGVHALPNGSNLEKRHLILEMAAAYVSQITYTPAVGDTLEGQGRQNASTPSQGARYTVKSVSEPDARRYVLVLDRLSWPGSNR